MLYENAFGAAGALLRECLFELVFANGTHPFLLRFIPYFTFRKLRFVSAFIWTGSGALLGGGEERLPFSCRLDAAGLTDDIVCGTAEFSGVFENHSGYLSITAKASLSLTVRCARCGKAFPLSETYALDCPVRVEGTGEDDGESVLVPADGQVDLRETAESFLLLSLPSRYLCRADCRGLCPECGRDLNEGTCTCGGGRVDPRLEKLRLLLEKKDET